MLVGVFRDRFLMRTPYRTLDRRTFGMRMVRTGLKEPTNYLTLQLGLLRSQENKPGPESERVLAVEIYR